MVTLQGESQADHQEAGQNQTKKRQLLQYQGIAGVFSLYNICDLRHERSQKDTLSLPNRYPFKRMRTLIDCISIRK